MWTSARAISTLAVSLALALGGACGSSPNGPTGAWADAGAAADAPLEAHDAGPELGGDETGVGLGCPASFTGRADGTPCFSVLTACDYPEGRCGCLICEMGAAAFGYAWACRRWDSGGNGCPARAPDAGAPCDGEGLVCRYGAYCSVSVGEDLQCTGGAWQAAPTLEPCGYRSCPL
ncbi:MAG TPA: hypothetical protein VHL80_07925 [Polyangia bacterium]|nr:hypothetical protein [Polyangia bacterium]